LAGQALSYKLGQLKIVELRKKAEGQLGAKFDVRDFHDVVLRDGSLPLELLQGRVEKYIAEGGEGVCAAVEVKCWNCGTGQMLEPQGTQRNTEEAVQ